MKPMPPIKRVGAAMWLLRFEVWRAGGKRLEGSRKNFFSEEKQTFAREPPAQKRIYRSIVDGAKISSSGITRGVRPCSWLYSATVSSTFWFDLTPYGYGSTAR